MAATSPPKPPPMMVMSSMYLREAPIERGSREPCRPWATPGDVEELIRRAQRGDTRALNALLSELAPYVGRICGAVALSSADDATQEALVAIFRHLPTLREPLALKAWARRIAVREALRAAGHRGPVPVDPGDLEIPVAVD